MCSFAVETFLSFQAMYLLNVTQPPGCCSELNILDETLMTVLQTLLSRCGLVEDWPKDNMDWPSSDYEASEWRSMAISSWLSIYPEGVVYGYHA